MGLAQQWDQLGQLVMRMEHNLEQQLQARNNAGVTEEQLKEFTASFRSVLRYWSISDGSKSRTIIIS